MLIMIPMWALCVDLSSAADRLDPFAEISKGYYTGSLSLVAEEKVEYGSSIEKLKLEVWEENDERLHLKITDAEASRWEIPETLLPSPGMEWGAGASGSPLYTLQTSSPSEPFGFRVQRAGGGNDEESSSSIFDSLGQLLIYKDQYIEFTTR